MRGPDWYCSSIAAYLETALHASYTVRLIPTLDTSLRQKRYLCFTSSCTAPFMPTAIALRYMRVRPSHFYVETGLDASPSLL